MVPSVCFLSIFYLNNSLLLPFSNEYFNPFLALVFLGTYLLPSIMILLLKLVRITDSFTLESKKDRIISAFAVLLLWGLFTYVLYAKYGINLQIIKVLLVICLILFLSTAANFFYRFSLHTFSVATLVAFLFFGILIYEASQLINQLLILILISGVIGWARMILWKHSLMQLAIGYLSGGVVGAGFAYYFFK